MEKKYICVTQIRSQIGLSKKFRLLIKSLGLKKLHKERLVEDNNSNRSILFKIQHLISISKKIKT